MERKEETIIQRTGMTNSYTAELLINNTDKVIWIFFVPKSKFFLGGRGALF